LFDFYGFNYYNLICIFVVVEGVEVLYVMEDIFGYLKIGFGWLIVFEGMCEVIG